MRKVILMMLLSVTSSNAIAEWISLISNENANIYIDPASVTRSGDMVTLWAMVDKKTTSSIGVLEYKSSKNHQQFDCKNFKTRSLGDYYYAENMGVKEIHNDLDASEWESGDREFIGIFCKVKSPSKASK